SVSGTRPGEVDLTATDLASFAAAPVVAYADETLRMTARRMARFGRTALPVVRNSENAEIVGEITLETMFKARVRHLEEEQRRERPLPIEAVLPVKVRHRRPVALQPSAPERPGRPT